MVEKSSLIKHAPPRREEIPRGERNTTNVENQAFLKDVRFAHDIFNVERNIGKLTL